MPPWQVEVEECLGVANNLDISGTVVVTDDGWGIAEQLCILLEEKGLDAVRIGFESEIRDMSKQSEGKRTVYRADPANIEHIEAVCTELNNLPISGVIHLAALKLAGFEWDEDTYPSSQITMAASGWFALLKGLDIYIRNKTKLPVNVSEDPLLAIVKGTGMVLENIKDFNNRGILINT